MTEAQSDSIPFHLLRMGLEWVKKGKGILKVLGPKIVEPAKKDSELADPCSTPKECGIQ